MANEIRIVMTGEDDMSGVAEKAAKNVAGSFDRIGDAASEAGGKADKLKGGFDKLGETGGAAEQKFIGLKDSISGTQDVMAGLQSGDISTLAGGLADLSGAAEMLWSSMGKVIVNIGAKIAAQGAEIASTVASTAATIAHGVAQTAVTVATGAWTAAQWLLNAALSANPIGLVIVAIAALVAGIVIAWKNSETFREIVTAAFNAVLGAVQAVWHWIADNWPLLLAIITGPIGLAVLAVVTYWDTIKGGAQAVWQFIVDRFNDLVGFFVGLPGRLRDAAGDMFGFLRDAFRAAINWVIDRWNGLEFSVPSVSVFGQTLGGGTIGVPNIPRLARGGITSGPTLAVVGDNPGGREAVIPLPAGGALGGTTINVYSLDGRGAAEAVTRALREAKRVGLTSLAV